MCPTLAATSQPLPRIALIFLILFGLSTIIRFMRLPLAQRCSGGLCDVNWCRTLQLVDGGKVSHHHAKCLGAVHSPKNLASDSFQFICNVVGQREDESGVDGLKWNV